MNNVKEIKREPRNKDTLDLLRHIVQQVEESDDATEVLAFVKIGKDYHQIINLSLVNQPPSLR